MSPIYALYNYRQLYFAPCFSVLGPGPGGHFHWRPYQMLEKEKKNAKKGYQNQGWGRKARIAKRVSKSRKMGERVSKSL